MSPTSFTQKYIVWMEDWKSPVLKEPTPDTSTSTSSDSDDTRDEILTYWFGANVNVCEFPVARSVTVMVTVFGDKFSRYTCVEDEELDDDEEEPCEPDEEELDELLLCEPDEDELLFCDPEPDDDTCCSICCGDEYSRLKLLS